MALVELNTTAPSGSSKPITPSPADIQKWATLYQPAAGQTVRTLKSIASRPSCQDLAAKAGLPNLDDRGRLAHLQRGVDTLEGQIADARRQIDAAPAYLKTAQPVTIELKGQPGDVLQSLTSQIKQLEIHKGKLENLHYLQSGVEPKQAAVSAMRQEIHALQQGHQPLPAIQPIPLNFYREPHDAYYGKGCVKNSTVRFNNDSLQHVNDTRAYHDAASLGEHKSAVKQAQTALDGLADTYRTDCRNDWGTPKAMRPVKEALSQRMEEVVAAETEMKTIQRMLQGSAAHV